MNQTNDNYLYSQNYSSENNNLNNYPNSMNNENNSPMIEYETYPNRPESPLMNMNYNNTNSPMGMDEYNSNSNNNNNLPHMKSYNSHLQQQHYSLPPVSGNINNNGGNMEMNSYNNSSNNSNSNSGNSNNGTPKLGMGNGNPNTKKFSFVNVTLNPQQKNGLNGMERSINYKQKRKIINKTQYNELMRVFQITEKPSHDERARLARLLGMSVREVQVWFQNRRAKNKKGARNRSSTPPFISYKPNTGISNSNCSSEIDSDKSSKGSPTMPKGSLYNSIAESNECIKTTFSYKNNCNNSATTPSTSNNLIPPKILPNPNQIKNSSSPIISPLKTGSSSSGGNNTMISSDFPYSTPINWNKNPPQQTIMPENGGNMGMGNHGEFNNKFLDFHQNYPTPQPSPPHEHDPNNEGKPGSRGRPRGHYIKKEGLNNESTSPEVMAAAEALTSLSALFMSPGNSNPQNNEENNNKNNKHNQRNNNKIPKSYQDSQDSKDHIKPYHYSENQNEMEHYSYHDNNQDYNQRTHKQPIHYNEKQPNSSNNNPKTVVGLPINHVKEEQQYSNNGNSSSNSSSSMNSSKRQRTNSTNNNNNYYYNTRGNNDNNNLDNDYDDFKNRYHKQDMYNRNNNNNNHNNNNINNNNNTNQQHLHPHQHSQSNSQYRNSDGYSNNGNYDDTGNDKYNNNNNNNNGNFISQRYSRYGNDSDRQNEITSPGSKTDNGNNNRNKNKLKPEKELYHKPIKYDTRSKTRSKSDSLFSLPEYQDQMNNNNSPILPLPTSPNDNINENDPKYNSNHRRPW